MLHAPHFWPLALTSLRRKIARWAPILGVWCSYSIATTEAAEFNFFVGYKGESTDNVGRVPRDTEHEWIDTLSTGFSYSDQWPNLTLRFAPGASYSHYRNETFEDQAQFTLTSIAVWSILPQRFLWTLEDNAGQTRRIATQPETPANIVTTNVFSTGPDLFLRLGAVNTLQLGARYADIYVEDSETDSRRATTYARWLYQATPRTVLSLNAERLDAISGNEQVSPNYRRDDVFAGIRSSLAHSTLALDLGKTRIERDGYPEVDSALGRLTWTHQLTATSTGGIGLDVQYGDTGSDLTASAAAANAPPVVPSPILSQNIVADDVFYAKRGELFYNYRGSAFNGGLRVFVRRTEFEVLSSGDREERGGSLDLVFPLTAASSLSLSGTQTETDFLNVSLNNNTDKTISLRFDSRIRQSLVASIGVSRTERKSTDPAQEFVDNRLMLSLVYTSAPLVRR